eukprot:GHVN01102692.1.p1 GENE.GHVN01102692.1~~GHVN01102692.1.p1  ORF type:complete len:359 (-),score=62.58 GHVN01102692.1:283-1359(-)
MNEQDELHVVHSPICAPSPRESPDSTTLLLSFTRDTTHRLAQTAVGCLPQSTTQLNSSKHHQRVSSRRKNPLAQTKLKKFMVYQSFKLLSPIGDDLTYSSFFSPLYQTHFSTSIPPPTRPDGRLTNTTESTTALNITHMINPKNQPHRRHASSFNRGPPFLFSAASYAWLRKAADGGNGDMGEYLFRYPNFEVKETLGVSSAQKHMEDFVFKNIKEFSPSLTVSSGLIYGSPFCVYRGDPNACHSFATVHVTHEMTNEEVKSRSSNISPRPPLSSSAHLTNVRDPVRMQDLISWCRVARSVNKECIVAFVSSDSAEMDEDGKVKEHDVRTPSPVRFIRFTAIETQLSSVWKHTKYLPS